METQGEGRGQTSRSLMGAFKPQGLCGPLPRQSFWSLGRSGAGLALLTVYDCPGWDAGSGLGVERFTVSP